MATDASTPLPFTFNDLVRKGGLDLKAVRFMRHQDSSAKKGRTPYELWRDNRAEFDRFQSSHALPVHRTLKTSTHWASFVRTPQGGTMFIGFYCARYIGLNSNDELSATSDAIFEAGSLYMYEVIPDPFLAEYVGRIFIDWGKGDRAFVQLASSQEKPILEITREYSDPVFPGYLQFTQNLSQVLLLPRSWIDMLMFAQGVYVLTCPRTKELYVGSASGAGGFFSRWKEYALTGHGGNVQLKSRESSDYQVAILEVAGSAANSDDIIAMESRWKEKLQTRAKGFGLNSN